MSEPTTDVIVIGAGVIGCSVAYELARAGRRVLVLDKGAGAGHGSTSASSAVIRFNYSTLAGVALAWESRQRWGRWADFLGGDDDGRVATFVRTGGAALESPLQPAGPVLALFDTVGVPYEVWDSQTLRARVPGLDSGRYAPAKRPDDPHFFDDPDGDLTAYWMPEAGFVDDPVFAAHNLMVAARRHGAQFRFRTEVSEVLREDGAVRGVVAGGERLIAPVVVNVAGPHSSHINALAGVLGDFGVSTRPLRQEVVEVAAPPEWRATPAPLVADLDLGTYLRGTPTGGLLVGGTEPECDPLIWLDDPDDVSWSVTKEGYEAQSLRAARRLPGVGIPTRPRGVVGVYDVADDWTPIYDRTSLTGYYVAIGTSGNQFKNAPVVGEVMRAIIEACEAGADHDRSPTRLTVGENAVAVDLGTFSRLRRIDRERGGFNVFG